MIHFKTKDNILEWLEKYCPRKAIVRSLEGAELLGGFSSIPPANRPGWIVRVTSKFNRVWLVAVIPNELQTDYEIRILKEVPWYNWIGTQESYLHIGGPLFYGDKPFIYQTIKERSKK